MGQYKTYPLNSILSEMVKNLIPLVLNNGTGIEKFKHLKNIGRFSADVDARNPDVFIVRIFYKDVCIFYGSRVDDHVDGWQEYGVWLYTGQWQKDIHDDLKKYMDSKKIKSRTKYLSEQEKEDLKILSKYK